MKYLLFTSIVLAVTMCQKDIVSNDQLPLNTEVLIYNNTILSNQEEGIKLKMSEVVNDSRCYPYDCVWEGDGALRMNFTKTIEHISSIYTLH
jgi:azurin